MKCKDCTYSQFIERNNAISTGWECKHSKIEESAKLYEKTHKRITKSVDFIGYKMIKTSVRWCPLKKENKND